MGIAVSAVVTLVLQRLHHLDQLKVLLNAVVMFHHTAVRHGASAVG